MTTEKSWTENFRRFFRNQDGRTTATPTVFSLPEIAMKARDQTLFRSFSRSSAFRMSEDTGTRRAAAILTSWPTSNVM